MPPATHPRPRQTSKRCWRRAGSFTVTPNTASMARSYRLMTRLTTLTSMNSRAPTRTTMPFTWHLTAQHFSLLALLTSTPEKKAHCHGQCHPHRWCRRSWKKAKGRISPSFTLASWMRLKMMTPSRRCSCSATSRLNTSRSPRSRKLARRSYRQSFTTSSSKRARPSSKLLPSRCLKSQTTTGCSPQAPTTRAGSAAAFVCTYPG